MEARQLRDSDELWPRLLSRFIETRRKTEEICSPLETDDHCIQSMPDVSPPKWHLGHTTWFFEAFLLGRLLKGYEPLAAPYHFLFNSYYEAMGSRIERPLRGLIARPTVEEVRRYRHTIEERVANSFEKVAPEHREEWLMLVELGIHHEQQHQELLLTDIKHVFWVNPLRPSYLPRLELTQAPPATSPTERWLEGPEAGVRWIGNDGQGFSYDNERPRHRVFTEDFELRDSLVTNGEFLEFMEAGGYRDPRLWLSDGWAAVQRNRWQAPLYWERSGADWWLMTLSGMRKVELNEPVAHVSYFEADAFARWKGARLPTEAEWECVAAETPIQGGFQERGTYHPSASETPSQLWGEVWQWTASPYLPYPGFRAAEGALGEYNGKFMCNQFVLRGGSCATPRPHIRATYRNYFPPEARWQFSGLRLAR